MLRCPGFYVFLFVSICFLLIVDLLARGIEVSRFLFVSICFDLFCDVEVSRFLFVSICVLRVGDVMLRCPVSICLHLFRFAGCLSFISSHEVLRCPLST